MCGPGTVLSNRVANKKKKISSSAVLAVFHTRDSHACWGLPYGTGNTERSVLTEHCFRRYIFDLPPLLFSEKRAAFFGI